MSDDVSSVYEQLRTNTNISLVALVILFYDYLLTFSLEYARFWECARWNLATVFFFLNRYLALFGLVPVVIQVFWTPSGPSAEKVCGGLGFFHQAIAVGIQVVIGLMLIMRTYALYNRNKWVLAFLCSSGAVVISYGVWVVCSGQNSHESPATSGLLPTSCFLPLSYGAARRLASAWTAMLCFDSVIFLLTLYRSFFYKRDRNFPLMKVMLRDGTAYFGIMTLATASVIYSLYKSPDYERGLTVTFTNVLSSCMLSRLMLNLRDPRLSSDRSRFSTTSGASQPVFTTIISTSLDDNPPEGVHPSYEMSASQGPRRISTSPPSAPGDNSV